MSSGLGESSKFPLRLPRNSLLLCVGISELVPFIARLLSVPTRGWEWVADYLNGFLFLVVLNLIPGGILYGLGKSSKQRPLAFWLALASGVGFLLWAHGTVNLRASSTAIINLFIIPVYGAGAVIVGWGVGAFAHAIIRVEQGRRWFAGIVGTTAILLGVGMVLTESSTVADREAKFPVVTVTEIPLLKRVVYPCCPLGRVDVLAFDNFDADREKEIAVFGEKGIALLKPFEFKVKIQFDSVHDDCRGCVHMYPYIVSDGKGSLLVASSDGVADIRGHLLWTLKASGFTRLVPIPVPGGGPTFFDYKSNNRIDRFDTDGKVLWSKNLNVSDIGIYVTPEGERLPFAITGYGQSQQLYLYDLEGSYEKL